MKTQPMPCDRYRKWNHDYDGTPWFSDAPPRPEACGNCGHPRLKHKGETVESRKVWGKDVKKGDVLLLVDMDGNTTRHEVLGAQSVNTSNHIEVKAPRTDNHGCISLGLGHGNFAVIEDYGITEHEALEEIQEILRSNRTALLTPIQDVLDRLKH